MKARCNILAFSGLLPPVVSNFRTKATAKGPAQQASYEHYVTIPRPAGLHEGSDHFS